jgi:uncharacterized membrane protein (UPF0127 family)
VLAGLAACSTTTVTSTVPSSATNVSPAPTTATTAASAPVITGEQFPRAVVLVSDTELSVWVADDPGERTQGLRGVEGLPSDVEGMLFVFETPTTPVFVMEDTLIPLDLWFFDDTGALVGNQEMSPCSTEPCSRYPALEPVRWALETPLGDREFEVGDRLSTSASG